jgi:hypothetical protein
VAVVILNTLPGALVDHGLIGLEAGSLLPLPGRHGERAELDPLHDPERLLFPLVPGHAVEARCFELAQKLFFLERARDASAPELWIGLEIRGNGLVADDVGDGNAPAGLEHPEDLADEPRLVGVLDEIQDAVGDHDIDGRVRDERMLAPEPVRNIFENREPLGVTHRVLS